MIKFKDNFAPERVSKTKPYRPDLPIRFGKTIIRKYLEAVLMPLRAKSKSAGIWPGRRNTGNNSGLFMWAGKPFAKHQKHQLSAIRSN